ncbi:WhiB family transcriptional regulator [Streptomyces sp. Lzd4kr]|nr:WhiB family transcriptional regulator [Streptomyces sp. Lzd4kr]
MRIRARTSDIASALADERIPFPHLDRPAVCQDDPALFAIEEVTGRPQRERTLARARLACSRCPVVHDCLKWALANPTLTSRGVWAATTPGQRRELRKRLVHRLGDDWIGAVAAQDRQRLERRTRPHTRPPTAREERLARLELELIPTRPKPYEPWREPLTPERRAYNLRLLGLALKGKAP